MRYSMLVGVPEMRSRIGLQAKGIRKSGQYKSAYDILSFFLSCLILFTNICRKHIYIYWVLYLVFTVVAREVLVMCTVLQI